MNQISKPHLVDLLRIFDRRKFFVPRIRYASVRSKPELLHDLYRHFGTCLSATEVEFIPKSNVPNNVPAIRYHLIERKFYFDGEVVPSNPQSASSLFSDSADAGDAVF